MPIVSPATNLPKPSTWLQLCYSYRKRVKVPLRSVLGDVLMDYEKFVNTELEDEQNPISALNIDLVQLSPRCERLTFSPGGHHQRYSEHDKPFMTLTQMRHDPWGPTRWLRALRLLRYSRMGEDYGNLSAYLWIQRALSAPVPQNELHAARALFQALHGATWNGFYEAYVLDRACTARPAVHVALCDDSTTLWVEIDLMGLQRFYDDVGSPQ